MKRFAVLPVLFATACLGTITGSEDDPPMPEPEPVIPEVKLTVRDGGSPQAGVKVLFQNADDSVIAEATTDASGIASAKMPNGGSVTVVRTYRQNAQGEAGPIDNVYTYVGVKSGDAIELVGEVWDATPVTAMVNVGLTNGEIVSIRTPCGEATGQAPMIQIELEGCGPETDFFVTNLTGDIDDDGTPSGPLYFAMHAPVSPAIDLSTGEFRGTLSTQYSATGGQPEVLDIMLQKRLLMPSGFLVFDSGVATTTTATTDLPELPNTEQIVSAYIYEPTGGRVIASRAAYSSAPTAIDTMAHTIASSSNLAFTNNSLSWTESPGTADLSVALIIVGAVDRQFNRYVAAPHTGALMTLPVLPGELAKYNVQSTDTPSIVHHLASATGGYDAVRGRVFNHNMADIAPMGGTAVASLPASMDKDRP